MSHRIKLTEADRAALRAAAARDRARASAEYQKRKARKAAKAKYVVLNGHVFKV